MLQEKISAPLIFGIKLQPPYAPDSVRLVNLQGYHRGHAMFGIEEIKQNVAFLELRVAVLEALVRTLLGFAIEDAGENMGRLGDVDVGVILGRVNMGMPGATVDPALENYLRSIIRAHRKAADQLLVPATFRTQD